MQSLLNSKLHLASGLIAIVLGGSAVYFLAQRAPQNPEVPSTEVSLPRQQILQIGGIERPASDIKKPVDQTPRGDREQQYEIAPETQLVFGQVPVQKPDANPAVASAYEALTAKQHPERLSPMILPRPFDKSAYAANPMAYLNVHEPGRVFQPSQPGPDIPVIAAASTVNSTIRQGESIRLSVKTLQNMPATFTSFDLGAFENGLSSITVAANEEGIATAAFTASQGTIGSVKVLAASPVATEQVRFHVVITRDGKKGQ